MYLCDPLRLSFHVTTGIFDTEVRVLNSRG